MHHMPVNYAYRQGRKAEHSPQLYCKTELHFQATARKGFEGINSINCLLQQFNRMQRYDRMENVSSSR